ncbi:type II secretion system minor pseudopilin GspH [Celerinatantimonas sp. MCCC 1A17872]|uniref:type II secretion system minor pseudopilin GspH n=1 Tax=Celerinatantimonas sp. MCCC 1A17872 TaxID=3177514 RepID=UPI0038C09435
MRSHGFSLLEMLLVIMLIGLGSAVVVLSMGEGPSASELKKQVTLIRAQLEYARDKAVLDQRPIGVKLTPHSYQFYLYQKSGDWSLLAGRFKPLKTPLNYQLNIDNKAVDLTDSNNKKQSKSQADTWHDSFSLKEGEKKSQALEPHFALIFTGDGVWPDFSLSVSHLHSSWQLKPDLAGDDSALVIGKGS